MSKINSSNPLKGKGNKYTDKYPVNRSVSAKGKKHYKDKYPSC